MKRHPALHPLSRDHHNVLVHARRLRGLDARVEPGAARQRFLLYAQAVLEPHFAEEDLLIAPRLDDLALRQRLLDEHADLRRRIAGLPTASAEEQADLGERLRLHVRFEEDVVYPHLEATDAAGLASLAESSAAFRQQVRPASADGGAEACFL